MAAYRTLISLIFTFIERSDLFVPFTKPSLTFRTLVTTTTGGLLTQQNSGHEAAAAGAAARHRHLPCQDGVAVARGLVGARDIPLFGHQYRHGVPLGAPLEGGRQD